MTVRGVNGGIINRGDTIRFVGEIPRNPSVGYASEMKDYLNNGQEYTVTKVNSLDDGRKIISAAHWNWDPRNVQKVHDEALDEPQIFLFNEEMLLT